MDWKLSRNTKLEKEGLRDDDDVITEGGGPLVGGAVPGRTRRRLNSATGK
jgi:hypothetical protein